VKRKHIIIIGGSFAGLTAASKISRRYQVTVIDPEEFFEWTPNIHEIVSGVKSVEGLRLSRREIVPKFGHQFLQQRVERLDSTNQWVITDTGRKLHFDACVIASGGICNSYGIEGVAQHTIGFRRAEDCQRIEERLKQLTQEKKSVSIAIVGAGISGIEGLGEILRLNQNYSALDIHVLEAADQILPGLTKAISEDLRAHCSAYPVTFYTNAKVREISASEIKLASGETIAVDLCIWAAGMVLPDYLRETDLVLDTDPWIPVNQSLQCKQAKAVFVAGDSALLPTPIKKQAYYAIEMGELIAENVQRYLRRRSLSHFRPSNKPILITFGDIDTYFVAGDTVLASKFFAVAKEGIYQLYMARLSTFLGPITFFKGVTMRFSSAAKNLLVPEIKSLSAFHSVRDSRVIQLPKHLQQCPLGESTSTFPVL